jgi:uncharacterized membrane protein YdbT with pleckstrin-like domain
MTELVAVIVLAGFLGTFAYAAGKEAGWKERHRNEVVCETLLDGSINCVSSKRVQSKEQQK